MHNAVYETYTSLSPVGATVPINGKVRIIRLLQLTYWRLKYFGMLRRVDWQVIADVSKDPNVLKFNQSKKNWIAWPWRREQYVPSEVRYLFAKRHGISQTTRVLEGTKPDITHFIFLELEFNLIRRNYLVLVSRSALTVM